MLFKILSKLELRSAVSIIAEKRISYKLMVLGRLFSILFFVSSFTSYCAVHIKPLLFFAHIVFS